MLRSMTAFARAACESDWGQASWELRGVNNRYLDVGFRLPEDLRGLEPRLRERIAARLSRGKVECSLRLSLAPQEGTRVAVDEELLGELGNATQRIAQAVPQAGAISVGDLLRWPGVVSQTPPDPGRVEEPVLALLDEALDDFVATREREGSRIAELVDARCAEISDIVSSARVRQPELVERARTRLKDKLEEVSERLDAERVEQEIVIVATKLDVTEEMDRLDSHVAEVRRVITQSKPAGRRLDFLMQELNREANTLGSKSTDTESTRASVDLKVLIEQIREQIQNVE